MWAAVTPKQCLFPLFGVGLLGKIGAGLFPGRLAQADGQAGPCRSGRQRSLKTRPAGSWCFAHRAQTAVGRHVQYLGSGATPDLALHTSPEYSATHIRSRARTYTHTLMATAYAGSLPRGPQDSPGQPGRGSLPASTFSITFPPIGPGLGEVECPWETEVGGRRGRGPGGQACWPTCQSLLCLPLPSASGSLSAADQAPLQAAGTAILLPCGDHGLPAGSVAPPPSSCPEGCPGCGSPISSSSAPSLRGCHPCSLTCWP